MEIILAGQPNCVKSTLINSVICYKSIASNFPGVSVEYTRGDMSLSGDQVTVVDLPGMYSLQAADEAEKASFDYLINSEKEN